MWKLPPAGLLLASMACGGPELPEPPPPAAAAGRTLNVGDIAPDQPAKRIRQLRPLADYLARHLADSGVTSARVVIARDIEEMSRFLAEGKVDLYLDSPFPVLAIEESGACRILLRRWVKNVANYRTLFIAGKDGEVESSSDLAGRVVAFQEPYSTSGFFLPAAHLVGLGLSLARSSRADGSVAAGEVGVFFTGDEENTVELAMTGKVAAGALADQDYEELPAAFKEKLLVVGHTDAVPRQLVAVRAGLEDDFVATLRSRLLELGTDGQEVKLAATASPEAWTWRFDELPDESEEALATLRRQMALFDHGAWR